MRRIIRNLSEEGLLKTVALLDEYENLLAPARERFAGSPGVKLLLSPTVDAVLMEAFLLHFCAIGARMTQPVEGWLHRSAERCRLLGLLDIARALNQHARAESGHHLMMIADVRSLTTRWNACHRPLINADEILDQPPSPGAIRYCQLHEDNIVGDSPYAQIAIEYEIEMLPLRYGEQLIAHSIQLLGPDILSCLSFVTEHIDLDVGHTKFNALQLTKIIERYPTCLPVLVRAGTAALNSYAAFLADCLQRAHQLSRLAQSSILPASKLSWQVQSPLKEYGNGNSSRLPHWLEDVRSLRGFVLYADGRRSQFKTAEGRYYDPDPIDIHAYHVLGYRDQQLVACIRVYPLKSDTTYCSTEVIFGEAFTGVLFDLKVQRTRTAEIGRWIVHPDHRTGGIAVQLAAGAAALARRLGFLVVVSSVGTSEKQDRLLARCGMKMAETGSIVQSDEYADRVRLMYGHIPNLYFGRIMDQMAETLGLHQVTLDLQKHHKGQVSHMESI